MPTARPSETKTLTLVPSGSGASSPIVRWGRMGATKGTRFDLAHHMSIEGGGSIGYVAGEHQR
jgi:hypothetical protein